MTPATVATSSLPNGPRATAFAPVPARIAAHAVTAPHRVAVADADVRLTYGELEERADRLARTLEARGAGPERCVALLLPRSAGFIVAALAVLKTGAAYLPLDPATPADRVDYILGDAGASVVLHERTHACLVPAGPWVAFDPDDAASGTPTAPAADPPTGRESLAYVIYTSGSTGRPKGVEITHANLAHLVDWHVAAFGVSADDRASQVAGLGFDAAVWEIWPHLAAGASVHVADERTHRSPQLLRDWLVAQEITIAFAPTLLAEQLVHTEWPERTALRTMLTGAERLNRRPVPGLPFRLVNNYGPTECTVVATSGMVAPEASDPGRPSIGEPIPGTVAMVLDESLQPVDRGEPGELVLAGPHVGRGYRDDPARTAERFVSVRAADGSAVRAYRTGDRVRLLADGTIDFLGRWDDQVKLRGHRIELAEIVGWLTRCPGVVAGTVVVLGAGSRPDDVADEGDRELAAYIVAAGDPPTAADVQGFLAAQLPDYMVPAHVVPVAALPLTPNGKLDTAALPRPVETAVPATRPASDDLADIQEWLRDLIAGLLNQPQIDVDDNIFLIGGHSMLAMQVVSRVRQRYGVKLALRQLFRAPTVSAISAEVAHQRGVSS